MSRDSSYIKILYFASLREHVGRAEELFELAGDTTIASLKKQLSHRKGCWLEAFSNDRLLLSSVNQVMVREDADINGGDEVAFFPPVTGG